jgi:hypothetical protein
VHRKPQQQTLSVRISDTLREYLERARDVISQSRGESVSTSDVAKMLLELAKGNRLDDRLEVADLMKQPTQTLLGVRQKWEQKKVLSRAELIVLAHYIQAGCEEPEDQPGIPSPESFIGLLEAFRALLSVRAGEVADLYGYYAKNLRPEFFTRRTIPPTAEGIVEAVKELSREVREHGPKQRLVFVGRNLYVALRDENLEDIAAVNNAMLPYMPALFRLAARGHWFLEQRPIRGARMSTDYASMPSVIPPVSAGDFRLTILQTDDEDLSMGLEMSSRRVLYPLEPYPKIREFVTMLERLRPAGYWKGREFFGYTDSTVPDKVTRFHFRHRQNGIAFGFSPEEWKVLRDMMTRALALPELRHALAEQSLQYGEV